MTRPFQTGVYQYLTRFRYNVPRGTSATRYAWRCPNCSRKANGYFREDLATIAYETHRMLRHP